MFTVDLAIAQVELNNVLCGRTLVENGQIIVTATYVCRSSEKPFRKLISVVMKMNPPQSKV